MQHNVFDEFLEALSTVRAGRPVPQGGLTAVPLLPRSDSLDVVRSRGARTLEWREATPPNPGRVVARNPSHDPTTVGIGELLDGGMSLRAVKASQTVPAGGEASVVVEPVGARWWDQGPLHSAGSVSPVAIALLLQASIASAGIAASARTALWSLPDPDHLRASLAMVGDAAHGWLLLDAGRPVAAWLARHSGTEAQRSHSENSLRTTLARGRPFLNGHRLEQGAGSRRLVLLPRDLRLVDRVLAALHPSVTPRQPVGAGT